ncbi:MAG: biotin--[acetyl-CoA-carboxylase] ligase [Flavobacteriales bacterium]|nr:biotin--[acetyl-CoA-carboxylase] ligase [Flavobacteriales bacterium]
MLSYFINECDSTNDEIIRLIDSNTSNFSCVFSFNQKNGRGQSSNKWLSENGKNIAISFVVEKSTIFNPNFFSFFIPVQLVNFLNEITHENFVIKWPNDVLYNNKKIAGILIEQKKIIAKNVYIIGIGININQVNFDSLPKATSLKNITSENYNLTSLATNLQYFLKQEYQKIEYKTIEEYTNILLEEYHQKLFGINQVKVFKFDNKIQNGIIQKVDLDGKLHLKTESEEIKTFKTKEIEMLY